MKSTISKILSTVLAVAMIGAMSASVFASEGGEIKAVTTAENEKMTPYGFTRHYSTQMSSGLHSVMSDSNMYDDDDTIRIQLTGNTTGGDITYLVREYSPFGNFEQYVMVALNDECVLQIQGGNNFSIFASTSSGSGTINTMVTLSTR